MWDSASDITSGRFGGDKNGSNCGSAGISVREKRVLIMHELSQSTWGLYLEQDDLLALLP